jgi:hypothetical protein
MLRKKKGSKWTGVANQSQAQKGGHVTLAFQMECLERATTAGQEYVALGSSHNGNIHNLFNRQK